MSSDVGFPVVSFGVLTRDSETHMDMMSLMLIYTPVCTS